MKSFFKMVLAIITSIIFLFLLVIIIIAISVGGGPDIKKHSYLIVNYGGELLEYTPTDGIETKILGEDVETLQRILSNLEKAAVDKKIDGVIFRIYGAAGGYAMMQEIRSAIQTCQDSGKAVYAFAETLSRSSMFLAAACDSVFVPPTAYISFTGFASEYMFIKNTLDKLGVKVHLSKIKDYKTAAEIVMEEKMTPAAREMSGWILNEIWEIYMQTVSADRNITVADVVRIMEKGVLSANEAKEMDLVDNILYWDQLEARLLQKDDKKLRTVSQSSYAELDPEMFDLGGDKKIAVIHAQGLIAGHTSGSSPALGVTMGSQSVINDFREAEQDEDVAAIVFRVNSGGGDHLTSDLIAHQVDLTAKVKPVVVSMVNVAASGGYAISYRASKIVANPATITGSIGSISGGFNLKGLYDKLGVTKDFVTRGPMALLFSDYHDPSPQQWKRLEENHWDGFNEWLRDVAKRRGLTFEKAEKLAMGRVWTGRQAKENGLIDEIGGLNEAIALAKSLAEIPEDEKVTVEHLPKEKSLPEMIFSGDVSSSGMMNAILYHYFQHDLPNAIQGVSGNRLWHVYEGKVN